MILILRGRQKRINSQTEFLNVDKVGLSGELEDSGFWQGDVSVVLDVRWRRPCSGKLLHVSTGVPGPIWDDRLACSGGGQGSLVIVSPPASDADYIRKARIEISRLQESEHERTMGGSRMCVRLCRVL